MSENYFLYATGFNENGQLTLREKQIITYPQKIEQFGEKKVILIAPGYENVLYLLENNELQQFGISNENHSKFFEDKSQIKNIKAGQDHFIVLTEDGSVYWWKAANSNSIYNESTTPKSPSLVLLNFPVKEIIAGGHSSYFLLENGDLFGLGANNQHQISSQEKQFFDEPILISSNVERAFSGCYSHQVFFIKSNKKLYCRGYNQYGQLGTGNTKNQQKDFHLKFFRNQNIVDISCGYCHTLIWIDSGKTQSIYSAGYMEYNGLNQDSHSTKFKRLLKYQDKRIIQISSGSQFSYILIPNNEFIVFGWNDDGQLGTRDNVNIKQPKNNKLSRIPKTY
ncbi:hypothetical protein M0811_06677 [Anaeramoeba ignava]|uniref:Regulator of chromosome condensation 1/beta-lactamase-inhibitor protein II n=1 Tax=Anaeramoeba ignava TaxID=1746090 RepID=A0A9Q0LRA2_ANAIG|nr:hypothetical protein M0811_06677 [Anaeramoeba ignava]